jgi:hypothetical protein
MLTGEIPHVRIGKRKLIPKAALERMLEGGGINADNNTAHC